MAQKHATQRPLAAKASLAIGEQVTCIEALIGGDKSQWQGLLSQIHKLAISVCLRNQESRGTDFANDVALRCIERIHRDEYKALRRFLEHRERYPSLELETWMRGIINNCLIDELRSLPTIARKRSGSSRSLTPRFHVVYKEQEHTPDKNENTQFFDLRRIFRWLRDDSFPEEQREILTLWLHGHSISECSQQLDIEESEVQLRLRAARRRLRRQFEEK